MSAMLAAPARPYSAAIPSPSPPSGLRLRLRPSRAAGSRSLGPRAAASATTTVSTKPAAAAPLSADRTVVRIGLPSKGRMAEQTLSLLKVPCFSLRNARSCRWVWICLCFFFG
jgi:ATP phosphoribosyltransferase